MTAARKLRLADYPAPVSPAAPPTSAPPSDAVAAWLDVLTRLLRLPPDEIATIRSELEDHLRERIRELLLAGTPEPDAIRTAIAELGDAAELSQRFRSARHAPSRRIAMNLLCLGLAGVALITSVATLSHTPRFGARSVSVYSQDPTPARAADAKPAADAARSISIGAVEFDSAPLATIFEQLAVAAKLKLHARWEALETSGFDRSAPHTLRGAATLTEVFTLLNEGQTTDQLLDFRIRNDILEIAPRTLFDHRETELVSFDVGPVLDSGVEPAAITETITTFIDSTLWRSNGGDTATIEIVGRRLFISAPPRMWRGAAWVIDQLGSGEPAKPRIQETLDVSPGR